LPLQADLEDGFGGPSETNHAVDKAAVARQRLTRNHCQDSRMSNEYLALFFAALLATWCNFYSKKSIITKLVFFFTVCLIILLAGLKQIGSDYYGYQKYFELSPELGQGSFLSQWMNALPAVEIGWVFLGTMFKAFGMSYEIMIFVVATVAVGLSSLFYYKQTRFYSLALLVYYSHPFFYREMVQIRIGIACSILIWSFYYLAKKQLLQSLIILIVACLIHNTVILAIVPMAMFHWEIRLKTRYIILLLMLALGISKLLNPSFPIFALWDRLAVYQEGEYAKSLGVFTNPVTIKQIVILLVSWWLSGESKPENVSSIFRLCWLSYLISTIWIISLSEFEILGARGANVLSIGEPLILSEIVSMSIQHSSLYKFGRLLKIAIVGFCLSVFIINIQIKKVVDDYKTIFTANSGIE
jgi:hypothetical protein